jgi:hypothetical protein
MGSENGSVESQACFVRPNGQRSLPEGAGLQGADPTSAIADQALRVELESVAMPTLDTLLEHTYADELADWARADQVRNALDAESAPARHLGIDVDVLSEPLDSQVISASSSATVVAR